MTVEELTEYYIGHVMDLVPYDDPRYDEKVYNLAKHLAEAELNPDSELTKLCQEHDELLSNNLL